MDRDENGSKAGARRGGGKDWLSRTQDWLSFVVNGFGALSGNQKYLYFTNGIFSKSVGITWLSIL